MVTIEHEHGLIHLGIDAEHAFKLSDLVSVEVRQPIPREALNNMLVAGEIYAYKNLVSIVDLRILKDAALAEIYQELTWIDPTGSTIGAVRREIARRFDGWVYLLKSPTGYWKIGKSVDPDNRIKTFGVLLPFEVEYQHLIPCDGYTQAEQVLHQRYNSKRGNGEWFALSDKEVEEIEDIYFIQSGQCYGRNMP